MQADIKEAHPTLLGTACPSRLSDPVSACTSPSARYEDPKADAVLPCPHPSIALSCTDLQSKAVRKALMSMAEFDGPSAAAAKP